MRHNAVFPVNVTDTGVHDMVDRVFCRRAPVMRSPLNQEMLLP